MKFSQKIFIAAFILIITAMYISGYIIIKNNHETNINKEIELAISQTNKIITAVKQYDYVEHTNYYKFSPNNRWETLYKTVEYLTNTNENLFIEIYKDKDILYNNMLIDTLKIEHESEKIGYCIKDVENNTILFTDVNYKSDNREYIIRTAKDISYLYLARAEQINMFLKSSIVLTFVSAFILAIFIYFITRRINKLEKNIEKVSHGNYDISFTVKGNDEITRLNKGFQQMIKSINNNINEIERISENRKDFINNITHEIRTPLTSIIGFSEILSNVKITNQDIIHKYANRVYENGKHIEQITDSLMQIILLDNNKVELKETNISNILKDSIEIVRDTLYNRKIIIQDDIKENVVKIAESSLIKSLAINLIKNAADSYEEKGLIKVILDDSKLKVIDYGKGIPKEDMEKIKEPFYTLDKARTKTNGGMGLGLPLCIKIVDIHGFKIDIKSEIGIGTTIIIEFNK